MTALIQLFRQVVKSPSFSSLAAFAGSNLFVAVVSGVTGLLQARWLSPDEFGEFRKYSIAATYLTIGVSFVHDGLVRQYPYLIGSGDRDRARDMAAVAKWWYCFLCWIYGAGFLALTIAACCRGDWRGACGWGAQILNAVALVYGAYQGVMYRTSSDFKQLSKNNVVKSLAGAVGVMFVKWFAYWGCQLRFSLINLVSLAVNEYYLPVKVKARFSKKEFIDLSKMSLRFAIPGYIHSTALVATVSSLMLFYCGQAALGIFGVAATLKGFALVFTDALNQIFNVKITTHYGRTNDIKSCLRYAAVPTCFSVALALVATIMGVILVGSFVELLMPAYVAAVPVIQVLLFAVVLKALALPLLVVNAALMYNTFLIKAILNFIVVVFMILVLPKNPVNFAIAAVLGESAELLVGYASVFRQIRQEGRFK